MTVASLLDQKIVADAQGMLNAYLKSVMPAFTALMPPGGSGPWCASKTSVGEGLSAWHSEHNCQPQAARGLGRRLHPAHSYVIRKLRYEAYPNYWIPGLLYEPTRLTGKVPVVLNPNGHHFGGKAVSYKQARCANIARRGMIALSMEFVGMGELEADCHHNNIAHLDLTGMAGVGIFYLAQKRTRCIAIPRPRRPQTVLCHRVVRRRMAIDRARRL